MNRKNQTEWFRFSTHKINEKEIQTNDLKSRKKRTEGINHG